MLCQFWTCLFCCHGCCRCRCRWCCCWIAALISHFFVTSSNYWRWWCVKHTPTIDINCINRRIVSSNSRSSRRIIGNIDISIRTQMMRMFTAIANVTSTNIWLWCIWRMVRLNNRTNFMHVIYFGAWNKLENKYSNNWKKRMEKESRFGVYAQMLYGRRTRETNTNISVVIY